MSGVEFHLVLAHVPVIGTFFVLGLFASAAKWRQPALWRAGAVSAVLMALCASLAMTSGPIAQDEIRASLDPAALELVRLHEVAGQLLTAALALVAVLSLQAWLVMGPQGPRARWIVPALLVATTLAAGAGVWAAGGGGRIRHVELRGAVSAGAEAATGFAESSLDSTTVQAAGSP